MKRLVLRLVISLNFLPLAFNCEAKNLNEAQNLRIVSLAPNTTEILFALDLADSIVGVDSFSNYPPETKGIEKVGSFSRPNIEKLLYLKPDIVFTTGLEQMPVISRLRRLGLNVFVIDPANIEELFSGILKVGKLTSREKEAAELVSYMRNEISKIKEKTYNIPLDLKPRVFLEFWYPPLMTCGKGSYLDELISLSGGINIAYDVPRQFSRFSGELVIKRSPEVIILAHMQGESNILSNITQRYGWKEINAVKNNRVYADINPDILLRPGPRVIEALQELYNRFYRYGKDLAGK